MAKCSTWAASTLHCSTLTGPTMQSMILALTKVAHYPRAKSRATTLPAHGTAQSSMSQPVRSYAHQHLSGFPVIASVSLATTSKSKSKNSLPFVEASKPHECGQPSGCYFVGTMNVERCCLELPCDSPGRQ